MKRLLEVINNLTLEQKIIAMLCIVVLYLLIKTSSVEKMANSSTDIRQAVKDVYKADVQAIKNLGDLAKQIYDTNGGTLTIPANVTVNGKLDVNTDITWAGGKGILKNNPNDGANIHLHNKNGKETIKLYSMYGGKGARLFMYKEDGATVETEISNGSWFGSGNVIAENDLYLGKKEKNKWRIHIPQDDRGLLKFSREKRTGGTEWGTGFEVTTNKDGTGDTKLNVSGNLTTVGNLQADGYTKSKAFALGEGNLDHNAAKQIFKDGILYRSGGQVYLGHDDNFYLRNNNNGKQVHFKANGDIYAQGTIDTGKLKVRDNNGLDFYSSCSGSSRTGFQHQGCRIRSIFG